MMCTVSLYNMPYQKQYKNGHFYRSHADISHCQPSPLHLLEAGQVYKVQYQVYSMCVLLYTGKESNHQLYLGINHHIDYHIAGYLHGVPIFAFFTRQNNLVKIYSYERTRIDRIMLKWFYPLANKARCTRYSNNQVHKC